jgi:nucleoside-diphosphate-sugar epimerase
VRDVALKLGHLLGRPELIRLGDLPYRPDDMMFVCANTQLLLRQTSWKAKFDLDEGLSNTIDWWRANITRS